MSDQLNLAGGQSQAAASAEKPAVKKASAPRAEPKASGVKLVKARVRLGTFVVGDGEDRRQVGPGGEVELPEHDVRRYRRTGHLHPESDSGLILPSGPSALIEDETARAVRERAGG